MKKVIAVAGLGAALATGALAIAPAASATPTSFLNDVYAEGFWNTRGDVGLLGQGYWVCNELDKGYTPDNVAMRLDWVNAFDPGAVGTFAAIATFELCPFHAGQGFYESRPFYASPQLKRAV
jgi:hypothetical protein